MIAETAGSKNGSNWLLLGDYYARGVFVETDGPASIDAYKKAVDAGDRTGLIRLAEAYRDGFFVPKNAKLSIGYYKKAIDTGQTSAIRALAEAHIFKKFGASSQPELGERLLNQAEQAGDKNAIVVLANLAFWGSPPDPARGLKLLTNAAAKGNDAAARALVVVYRDGRGKAFPRNITKARTALEKYASFYSHADMTRDRLLLDAAAATGPKGFSQLSADLKQVATATQSSVILALRYVNPNAYVFVIQEKLKERGIYAGKLDGLLTRQTITAFNALCRESKNSKQCDMGPLNSRVADVVLMLL